MMFTGPFRASISRRALSVTRSFRNTIVVGPTNDTFAPLLMTRSS
jgi:hypothetical protein